MPGDNATRRRGPLRRRVAACALLLLLGSPVVAAEAAPARAVVVADLRGTTTISWTSNAAIRLRVPNDVRLPAEAFRFTVRTGRFVSVRAFVNPQPIGCREDFEQEWCAGSWLDWVRDLAETSGHGVFTDDPARDFISALPDPPVVRRGGWDLYLFTDGRATLEITARGVAGRASYVAGGRFSGRALLAPGPCRLAVCPADPVHADQRTGGGVFDVGRGGMVHAMAYGAVPRYEPAPGARTNQPFLLRTCQYPDGPAPDASADPARHPDGCDTPSTSPDDAVGVVNEVGGTGPARFRAHYGAGSFDARGRVYLGFRASSAGPARPRLGGLLIWLRYGIR